MYMTVSGAPVKKARHAEPISAMALDMLEAVKQLKNPANDKPMTVTIGKLEGTNMSRYFKSFLRRCKITFKLKKPQNNSLLR